MIKTKTGHITEDEFRQICAESESVREVVTKLGYAPNGGGTAARVKEDMAALEIDDSHFKGQGHSKNTGTYRTPIEKYLNNEVKITSHKLRIRLIDEGILEEKCNSCGLEEWMGKPIPLELHHKDGNKDNNGRENLELLCPNCHTFTDTYKTRNWDR